MSKQEQITPSADHLWLRVIAFVLALIVAVGAISYGVTRIGRKEAGYHEIETDPDEEALLYAKNISFQYYFSGGSDEIKKAINELKALYSPTLLRVYKLLDADVEYEGMMNVASLNAHIGEDVAVSAELYGVLQDAQAKTREQKGYTVFGGALARAWREIRYLSEPGDFDPLHNEAERERLDRLREATNDLTQFNLTFVDGEKHIVRLNVSDSYRSLLRELEQEGPILDLGVLHDAYELQLLGEALESAGYCSGYLTTNSGAALMLSGNPYGELSLLGQTDEGVTEAAAAPAEGGRAASLMRCFAQAEGEPDYYALDGQLRHPWLPASGEYRSLLLSALTVADDPVTACYQNLCLQELPTAEAIRAAAAASDTAIAYVLNNGEATVYANSEQFTACTDYGWRLEPIR